MLSYDEHVQGALIRGILPTYENQVADIGSHMVAGNLGDLKAGGYGIVLGSELAASLGAHVGEKVVLIAPQGQVTPAGLVPRLKQFTVVGLFEVGMFEYDSGLALIQMEDAQKLYRLDNKVSGVRLKLKELFRAPLVARQLAGTLSADAYISDWTKQHANFFRAVQIEKNVMFIILLLIVAVAAFNIVSTLVMAVTDKQADIAILRTLGAAPVSIMQIFMVQGSLIGVIGTCLGVIGGVLIAYNVATVVPFLQRVFGFTVLDPSIYYIKDLPSDLQWRDVTAIAATSLVLSFLATLYPSYRASRIRPAEALRYE
jgi:lipoprotein-releasing system permease protein